MDDHVAVRAGLVAVLRSEPGVVPVTAAGTAAEALKLIGRHSVDVAVLDYHLPDGDGLRLSITLKSRPDPPRVLIYSAFAEQGLAVAATVARADGLLDKTAPVDRLFDALRLVARGEPVMPPVSRELMEACAARLDAADLPILGMALDRTPPSEMAAALRVDEARIGQRLMVIAERLRMRHRPKSDPDAHAA